MSTATNISEKVITSVVDHQFNSLVENMSTCNSLEISGFGKFVFNKKKGVNMMLKYIREKEQLMITLDTCIEERVRKRAEIRISQIEISMRALNQKLQSYENQFCTSMGRLEESHNSSSRDEGTNKSTSC